MPPTLYFVFRSPGPRSRNLRWFLRGVGVHCARYLLSVVIFAGHCCFCDCLLPDIPGACSTVVACRERTLTNFLAGVSGCSATVCGVLLAFVFACKDRTTANFLAGVSVPKGTATANVFAGVPVLCWYVCRLQGQNSDQLSSRCFRLYCYRVWRAACFCVCLQGQNYRNFSGRCFCA